MNDFSPQFLLPRRARTGNAVQEALVSDLADATETMLAITREAIAKARVNPELTEAGRRAAVERIAKAAQAELRKLSGRREIERLRSALATARSEAFTSAFAPPEGLSAEDGRSLKAEVRASFAAMRDPTERRLRLQEAARAGDTLTVMAHREAPPTLAVFSSEEIEAATRTLARAVAPEASARGDAIETTLSAVEGVGMLAGEALAKLAGAPLPEPEPV